MVLRDQTFSHLEAASDFCFSDTPLWTNEAFRSRLYIAQNIPCNEETAPLVLNAFLQFFNQPSVNSGLGS